MGFEGKWDPKVMIVKLASKVTVFWDVRRIILKDSLVKTIPREYYASLLHKLNEATNEKRLYLKKGKILFYEDNVRIHTSSV